MASSMHLFVSLESGFLFHLGVICHLHLNQFESLRFSQESAARQGYVITRQPLRRGPFVSATTVTMVRSDVMVS